jgi:hypothetical protein
MAGGGSPASTRTRPRAVPGLHRGRRLLLPEARSTQQRASAASAAALRRRDGADVVIAFTTPALDADYRFASCHRWRQRFRNATDAMVSSSPWQAIALSPSRSHEDRVPEPVTSMPLTYSVGISSNGHRFAIASDSDAASGTSVSRCITRSSMPAWA